MSGPLGEALLKQGLLTREQFQAAVKRQSEYGGRLASILIEMGFVGDEAIAGVLSRQYRVQYVNLANYEIDDGVIDLVPIATAIRHQVLPLRKEGTTLFVAVADPTDINAVGHLEFMTGLRVTPLVAPQNAIRAAIEKHYGTEQAIELKRVYDQLQAEGEYELSLAPEETEMDLAELQKGSTEAPLIKLVNLILAEAIRKRASDIHIEPFEKNIRVRYRIDGVLFKVMDPPFQFKDAIVSRIKIMSSLDIAERRVPQDGRIKIRIKHEGRTKEIDFRVSTLPTMFGEKVVMRILDREKLPLDLTKLGFEPDSLRRFDRAVKQPYGMILVTGPTGSGKTSTLYTCLNQLNTLDVNIMTAEDPVEFNFPGINQVQTKEQVGLTFAIALRAFLRQDPNIIMVGEIRDLETAEIAVRAALTGHLVLSTLHTNDAPSSVSRMVDMGIEPFLVTTSVNLICAQRLVRRICPDCKQRMEAPMDALVDLGFSPTIAQALTIYHGKGCRNCNNSGYRGRIGLYEVMEMTPTMQNLVLSGGNANQIREVARKEGMLTLRESGLEKIRTGVTTIEEVLRETATF